jgi:uncharacterized protein YcgI (DUF1989 family)
MFLRKLHVWAAEDDKDHLFRIYGAGSTFTAKESSFTTISQANSATVQAYRRVAPSFLSLGGSAFDFGLKVPIPN